MAEGENKSEKKIVEINVWFFIMLIVLIVGVTACIFLNNKVAVLNARNAELEQSVVTLQKTASDRANLIKELAIMNADGTLSRVAFENKLTEAGIDVNNLPTQPVVEEVVSGEVLETPEAE